MSIRLNSSGLLVAIALSLFGHHTEAYVIQANFSLDGRVHTVTWQNGVATYYLDTASFPFRTSDLRRSVDLAARTWTGVLNVDLSVLSDEQSTSTIRYVSSRDDQSIPPGAVLSP